MNSSIARAIGFGCNQVFFMNAMTMAEWQSAQMALCQNETARIWFGFLCEGASA
jgi:hypothetical protein